MWLGHTGFPPGHTAPGTDLAPAHASRHDVAVTIGAADAPRPRRGPTSRQLPPHRFSRSPGGEGEATSRDCDPTLHSGDQALSSMASVARSGGKEQHLLPFPSNPEELTGSYIFQIPGASKFLAAFLSPVLTSPNSSSLRFRPRLQVRGSSVSLWDAAAPGGTSFGEITLCHYVAIEGDVAASLAASPGALRQEQATEVTGNTRTSPLSGNHPTNTCSWYEDRFSSEGETFVGQEWRSNYLSL